MPRKKAEPPKVSENKKKPAIRKPKAATPKKTTTKAKPAVRKPKAVKKPTTRKKPELKPKRKELSKKEMFPFESFPFRLEYTDGKEHRVCHFQCEAHRVKHIERYKLPKGTYFIDTLT